MSFNLISNDSKDVDYLWLDQYLDVYKFFLHHTVFLNQSKSILRLNCGRAKIYEKISMDFPNFGFDH